MLVSSGIKFRCYPTKEQASILSQWIGCQRFIYNAKVSEDRYFKTFGRKSLSLCGIFPPEDQAYAHFKDRDLTPFLYDVPPQILRNGATRFMGALIRHKKGLAERPTYKKKYNGQSVWITSELFRFAAPAKAGDDHACAAKTHVIVIGNSRYPLGELKFRAHSDYEVPSTITISTRAGKWFLTFSYSKSGTEPDERELIDHFGSMAVSDLSAVTFGGDLGVAIPLAGSGGEIFDFKLQEKARLLIKEKRKQRYQRRMARQVKGSGRRLRNAVRAAKCSLYTANARHNFAHQTSRALADSDYQVFVFEDIKTKNLTKRPEPRLDEAGAYVANGAKAKAHLNGSILNSSWGNVRTFLAYKARRAWKLVINVSPHHTSQECSNCSHTHPDNRKGQAVFECQNCGFTANADTNAAIVIKKRGVQMLHVGRTAVKEKKRTMRLRKKSGLGREPTKATRGEKDISRIAGICGAQPSTNRETPTTIEVSI
jgi:putative transposase